MVGLSFGSATENGPPCPKCGAALEQQACHSGCFDCPKCAYVVRETKRIDTREPLR